MTNIPFYERLQIIDEITHLCLSNNSLLGDPARSLWFLLFMIFNDNQPGPYNNSSRIKAVKFIKEQNPNLYEMIKPWSHYVPPIEDING